MGFYWSYTLLITQATCFHVLLSQVKLGHHDNRERSPSMQCWNEHNTIFLLKLIVEFSKKFPVCIVDKDKNTGADSVTKDKQLWALLQKIVFDPFDQGF